MLKKYNYEKQRFAFLIDTPIQLFNAIEYIITRNLYGMADAYIQTKFRNANILIERVKYEKIFNNIYLIKQDKNGKLKHLGIINGLLFPRLYVKIIHNLDIYNKQYKCIFVAFVTKTFDFLIAASGCRNIIGFDDGLCSYLGDPFSDYYNKRYLIFRKIVGRSFPIKKIYLNNPAAYRGISTRNPLPICRKLNISEKKLLYKIFDYKETNLYKKNNIICLNQPITHISGYYQKEKELINIANEIVKDKIVVRLHPTEKNKERYSGFKVDDGKNIWELLCMEQIDNNFLLIAYFSTAQLMPKFLADKEPFIIFTFNLYPKVKENLYINYCDLVNSLRDSYKNKERIYTPETLDEYCENIRMVCSMLKKTSN